MYEEEVWYFVCELSYAHEVVFPYASETKRRREREREREREEEMDYLETRWVYAYFVNSTVYYDP